MANKEVEKGKQNEVEYCDAESPKVVRASMERKVAAYSAVSAVLPPGPPQNEFSNDEKTINEAEHVETMPDEASVSQGAVGRPTSQALSPSRNLDEEVGSAEVKQHRTQESAASYLEEEY